MTFKAEHITGYPFQPSDELLLDANIWIFLYSPQKPGDKKVKIYSEAFKKILEKKCRIFIDVLIVSEFINTCARLQWRIISPEHSSFKSFRQSTGFKPVAGDIAKDVKRILQDCTPVDSGFGSIAIDQLMDEFSEGGSDFNDQIFTALCKSKGLKLVTHDGDFQGKEIHVLTANQGLLT